jgi:hypothetical protein
LREGAGFLGLSAGRGDIFSFPGLRFSVTSLNHKKAKGNPLFRPSCNSLKVNTDTAYPDTRGKAEKLSPALTFQAQTGERLVSLPAETIVSTRRDERIYK